MNTSQLAISIWEMMCDEWETQKQGNWFFILDRKTKKILSKSKKLSKAIILARDNEVLRIKGY